MIPRFNWCLDKKLTTNKALEVSIIHWDSTSWFDFKLRWNFKGDHCGPELWVEIYGFLFASKIYDCRHWNWGADRFYESGEETDDLNLFMHEQIDASFKRFEEEENKKL